MPRAGQALPSAEHCWPLSAAATGWTRLTGFAKRGNRRVQPIDDGRSRQHPRTLGSGLSCVVRLAIGSSIAVEAHVLASLARSAPISIVTLLALPHPRTVRQSTAHPRRTKVRRAGQPLQNMQPRENLCGNFTDLLKLAAQQSASAQLHTLSAKCVSQFPPNQLSRSTSAPPQSMRWD